MSFGGEQDNMDAEESRSTRLQDLPFDCLYHIFRYLSVKDKLNFSRSCSEWINLDSIIGQISELAIVTVNAAIKYMPRRTLNLQDFHEIMINWGFMLKKFSISLGGNFWLYKMYVFDDIAYEIDGDIDYETLMDIVVKNCHNLKKLELWGSWGSPNFTEKFSSLLYANQKLTDLKLDVSDYVLLNKVIRLKDASGPVKNVCLEIGGFLSTDTVNNLCELFKLRNVNLKELRLFCSKSKDMMQSMRVLANYARELQVLHLHFDDKSHDFEVLLALEKLSVLTNLEELSIEVESAHIEDEVYSMVTRNCTKLKKIKLYWHAVTDKGLRTLMTSLPNLVSVSLIGATVHSVAYSNVQNNLISLEIISCFNLSEDALKKISLLTNLKKLAIAHGGYRYCSLTDNVITEITLGCRKLKKVTIAGCRQITGNGINTLVTAIPNLESVVLIRLRIDFIVHSNAESRIQSLELDHCKYLEKNELKKIAVFRNLKELCVKSMGGMTDEALLVISSACKQLTKVTLCDIQKLTYKAIHTLVSTLPKLEYLELDNLKITSILPKDYQLLKLPRLKVRYCDKLPKNELERAHY